LSAGPAAARGRCTERGGRETKLRKRDRETTRPLGLLVHPALKGANSAQLLTCQNLALIPVNGQQPEIEGGFSVRKVAAARAPGVAGR
jgi:hypothetical protein